MAGCNENNNVTLITDSLWQRLTNPEAIRTAKRSRPGELPRRLVSAGWGGDNVSGVSF